TVRVAYHAAHKEEARLRARHEVACGALCAERDRPAVARLEVEPELGACLAKARGLRPEREARRARQAAERVVVKGDFRRPEQLRAHRAAARAPIAADLEEVGEVGGEIEREVQLVPALRVAGDGEELVAAGVP